MSQPLSRHDGIRKRHNFIKLWLPFRRKILKERLNKCGICGKTPKEHGVSLEVDHIKPRYKFPELALVGENIQILCKDCHAEKSTKEKIDWHVLQKTRLNK